MSPASNGVRVPATDYHPVWLDSLANDVTIEGSAMNGVVQGAGAVRSIVTYIRTLYDDQEFNFAGSYGENGFLEDYTARVRGEQIGNVVLVTRNAAGQAQHIVANYRPRVTLLLLSRLIGQHFAGTPTASTSPLAPPSESSMGTLHRVPGSVHLPRRRRPPARRQRMTKRKRPEHGGWQWQIRDRRMLRSAPCSHFLTRNARSCWRLSLAWQRIRCGRRSCCRAGRPSGW